MYRVTTGTSFSRQFENYEGALKCAKDIFQNPGLYFPQGSKAASGHHGYSSPEELIIY